MPRIPQLKPEEMNDAQRRVYDDVMATTGRIGGPSTGYMHSPVLWERTNAVSAHFGDCALSQRRVKIAALVAARHWSAKFPWSAQVRQALDAGVEMSIIDAINARTRPDLPDAGDAIVYDVAVGLLESGNLTDDTVSQASDLLGYAGFVDAVGAVGHFCKVCMMANAVGAEAPADSPSHLQD